MKSLVTLSIICCSFGFACSSAEAPSGEVGASGASGSGGQAAGVSGSGSGTSAGGGGGAGGGDTVQLHGAVVVALHPAAEDAEGYTSVLARFFDGPTPDALPNRLKDEVGDCQLLVPDLPFCSSACTPAVCTASDVCTPYPNPKSAGTLELAGLGAALQVEPATTMFVYQPPSLPNPPCVEGEEIAAKTEAFELSARCIPQLELTGADPIPVMSGQTVHVEWVPPAEPASSRIRIGLDISHHGGKKGEISCDVPDTGSFDIPASLVTQLVELGLAGFPTINVNRVSVDESGGASLVVSSDITRAVDTGVTSCQEDTECPDGQTCQKVGICG